jgi:hypothetical protein
MAPVALAAPTAPAPQYSTKTLLISLVFASKRKQIRIYDGKNLRRLKKEICRAQMMFNFIVLNFIHWPMSFHDRSNKKHPKNAHLDIK